MPPTVKVWRSNHWTTREFPPGFSMVGKRAHITGTSFAEIREQEKHLASGQGALAEIQTPLLIAGQPSATDFSSHLSPFTCNKN